MTHTTQTPDFTLKETQGANGFNYWIKGVGNLYPDDQCTDEKLALIAAAPELLEALELCISRGVPVDIYDAVSAARNKAKGNV